MPFLTDDEGTDQWVFSQPDDLDHLGRANHEGHGCEFGIPATALAAARRAAKEAAEVVTCLERGDVTGVLEAADEAGQWLANLKKILGEEG